jgi:hypothetical protein
MVKVLQLHTIKGVALSSEQHSVFQAGTYSALSVSEAYFVGAWPVAANAMPNNCRMHIKPTTNMLPPISQSGS